MPIQPNEQIVIKANAMPDYDIMPVISRGPRAPGDPIHVDIEVVAEALERQAKRAFVTSAAGGGSTFEIRCDEAAFLGGDDSAPSPLSYLSAGVAFCFLTHVTSYVRKTKLSIDAIKVELRARYIKQTIQQSEGGQTPGGCEGLDLYVKIDSPEPSEKIAQLVAVCRKACMAVQSFANAVPTSTELVHNGVNLGS